MVNMAREIIGRGWPFPLKINARGGLDWTEGPRRIQDSIWIILATALGERIMRPRFGCGVHRYVFESNSPVIRAALETDVRGALTRWEPRIELEMVRVEAAAAPSEVRVVIDYRIRATNELFNLVFPLYLEEGVG